MKKLFAIVFTLAILFSSFITRAEATTTGTDQADNSTLTIEVMEKLLSWEDLVNRSKTVVSEEDLYVKMMVEGIDEAYGTRYNTNFSLGGIRSEKVDYERLMKKLQRVIDVYNLEKHIHLEMTPKILSEFTMQIDVQKVKIEKWDSLEIVLIVVLSYYMCYYYFQQKQKQKKG